MIQTSFSLFPNCFCTALYEPMTNGVIRTFTFHILSNSLARFWYFSIFSFSLSSILISRNCKINDFTSSILLINYNQIRFPGFYYMANLILKSHTTLQSSFSETLAGSPTYHLPFKLKLQFLTVFQ